MHDNPGSAATDAARAYFITGTDTGCGKTLVTSALLTHVKAKGHSCLALKPVATGARLTPEGLRNDDALQLQQLSSVRLPYQDINPYVYAPAVSPHLAAAETRQQIDLSVIVDNFSRLRNRAQFIFVEGVGGWYAPLTTSDTVADLAEHLGLPVILVVGLRLGCLNHALLSYRAIKQCALPVAGWVANSIDPAMEHRQQNIDTLQRLIDAPLLATLTYQTPPDLEQMAQRFNLRLATNRQG